MELVIKHENTPIKAIPEIDTLLETQVKAWLSVLLSIKAEKEIQLNEALKGIKKHCWSLGFLDIKKMFEMYVDGQLSVKPVSGYLDRALVGQIYQSYKSEKRSKPEAKLYDKIRQDELDAINHYDYFLSNRKVDRRSSWVYLFLEQRELINDSHKVKWSAYNNAVEQKASEPEQLAMRYLLRKYFERLEVKGKHLKDLL